MLIELLCPRRNNAPVTMPDGSRVQFNADEQGRLVADIANDQALLILRFKSLYARADVVEPAAAPASEDIPVAVRQRGRSKRTAE